MSPSETAKLSIAEYQALIFQNNRANETEEKIEAPTQEEFEQMSALLNDRYGEKMT